MRKIAVIDGDSICFLCSKDTLEESKANVDSILADIFEETGSTHYFLFLSSGPYFRHQVNPEYKANRPPTTLLFIKELRKHLKDVYNALIYEQVEADDMVAYVMGNFDDLGDKICCGNDKDVTYQVPGNHLNYRTFDQQTTTVVDAIRFLYTQVLTGDSSDNIKGIPGIGPKKAEKILGKDDWHNLHTATLSAYYEHYDLAAGQAVFEFQKNFRQVYLLRRQEDFTREVGYIPELPEPFPINK